MRVRRAVGLLAALLFALGLSCGGSSDPPSPPSDAGSGVLFPRLPDVVLAPAQDAAPSR
jgi:hypothetical protein